jgi:hypothetical protein
MTLYRGVRHQNGRTDVIVYERRGERWLRGIAPESGGKMLQYDWGNDRPGTRMLALHLLNDAMGREDITEELVEDFCYAWLGAQKSERWAFTAEEISMWCVDELWCRLETLKLAPKGGLPPCPSDN